MRNHKATISCLQVMESNAGFYIGRGMNNPDDHPHDWVIPYSRESGYFNTQRESAIALENYSND